MLVNGVVMGCLLLLFSLGLSLIYGVGRIVNFAHGAMFSAATLLGVWLSKQGLPFAATLVVAPLAIGVVGALVDWAFLARIRNRPAIDGMLLTFGVALLLTGILQELGGKNVQSMPTPDSLEGIWTVGGVMLPTYRVFMAAAAIGLAAALLLCLKLSNWGLRVRAANDEPEMAACIGINRESLMHSVVGVSSGLAALSGVIAVPIYNAFATVGDRFLILGFMTVIMGGLGSLRGAIAAAFIVGLVLVAGEGYLGGQLSLMVLFTAVMVVLISFPKGIFGDGRTE